MIQLMLENAIDSHLIKDSLDELSVRFIESCLELKVGCIIDAGAVLAGKKLEKEIIPWISSHKLFKELNYKGISYCSDDGVWRVYDNITHSIVARETSIPEP